MSLLIPLAFLLVTCGGSDIGGTLLTRPFNEKEMEVFLNVEACLKDKGLIEDIDYPSPDLEIFEEDCSGSWHAFYNGNVRITACNTFGAPDYELKFYCSGFAHEIHHHLKTLATGNGDGDHSNRNWWNERGVGVCQLECE